MPYVRPCRNRWCPEYAGPDGWCPAHTRPPFASSAPMPPGWAALRAACLVRDGWTCQACGAPATDADHIVPRSAGGTDDLANLQALCGPCHHRRTGQMFGGG
jgi:5-methylcytosine-specific restriction protein A